MVNELLIIQVENKNEAKMKFWESIEKIAGKFKNINYATDFYRAMSNMRWQNIKNPENIYSCTWRYAGGKVAEIRNCGEDYLDFYCSGNEGYVSEEIKNDLNLLGWIELPWED